jgi:tRNA1Val (adenine37-N6)-methyltransferase
MKVGVDGVLLGAWADVDDKMKNILDIGTGTGLIALMVAQRCDATIDAIDIDENAVLQATENIASTRWNNRIDVKPISLQHHAVHTAKKYDLIISNPPFFVNSLVSPSVGRTNARHTGKLTHEELLGYSKKILAKEGNIRIILPVAEADNAIDFAQTIGLYCTREIFVFPTPQKPPKRKLLAFEQSKKEKTTGEITIQTTQRHQYTAEFIRLTEDYYL